jgi:hypothetical protein
MDKHKIIYIYYFMDKHKIINIYYLNKHKKIIYTYFFMFIQMIYNLNNQKYLETTIYFFDM